MHPYLLPGQIILQIFTSLPDLRSAINLGHTTSLFYIIFRNNLSHILFTILQKYDYFLGDNDDVSFYDDAVQLVFASNQFSNVKFTIPVTVAIIKQMIRDTQMIYDQAERILRHLQPLVMKDPENLEYTQIWKMHARDLIRRCMYKAAIHRYNGTVSEDPLILALTEYSMDDRWKDDGASDPKGREHFMMQCRVRAISLYRWLYDQCVMTHFTHDELDTIDSVVCDKSDAERWL
ncbi:hypothetical protein BDD12DRAFT_882845 [Trichophaea hybrida]|nr:hypothetical protein BDD12DRAFT_882845 [Trichophaea hybrida]